jgi:hypothetical protein
VVFAPGLNACQLQQFVKWKLVPGLVPVIVTFQKLLTETCCEKLSVTVQPLTCVVPLLVTVTST